MFGHFTALCMKGLIGDFNAGITDNQPIKLFFVTYLISVALLKISLVTKIRAKQFAPS